MANLMRLLVHLLILLGTSIVSAQSLAESLADAIAAYSQLSGFTQWLGTSSIAAVVFSTNSTLGTSKQTILVPSNDAFSIDKRQAVRAFGTSIIENVLRYQSVQGAMLPSNMQSEGVASTAFTDPTYDNRRVDSTEPRALKSSEYQVMRLR